MTAARVVIHPEPGNATSKTAVYAARVAETSRQAVALAAARQRAAHQARLRDRYGGPPLDPVRVAAQARAVLDDDSRWPTTLFASRDERAVSAALTAVPEVVGLFGPVALHAAAGRILEGGTCRWCLVPLAAMTLDQPEPPFDPPHRRLLGSPCQGCATRLRDRALTPLLGSLPARPRRAPDPPYFRRQPIRWPDDPTRPG
jgi:hypothetical protein